MTRLFDAGSSSVRPIQDRGDVAEAIVAATSMAAAIGGSVGSMVTSTVAGHRRAARSGPRSATSADRHSFVS